ncbi:hypothetical protein EVAR_85242_1 [Eumeta japonica]|uniref:Uncharacterized protein n=1 Tax=Eumeta variegata TaxID=151549 RepID=A0A4C1VYH7_EUMVA|nr:hypothetical protein EVAR_85242_1 [Eumeta japonica]
MKYTANNGSSSPNLVAAPCFDLTLGLIIASNRYLVACSDLGPAIDFDVIFISSSVPVPGPVKLRICYELNRNPISDRGAGCYSSTDTKSFGYFTLGVDLTANATVYFSTAPPTCFSIELVVISISTSVLNATLERLGGGGLGLGGGGFRGGQPALADFQPPYFPPPFPPAPHPASPHHQHQTDDLREGRPSTATTDVNISAVRLVKEIDKRMTYQQILTSLGIGMPKILHEHLAFVSQSFGDALPILPSIGPIPSFRYPIPFKGADNALVTHGHGMDYTGGGGAGGGEYQQYAPQQLLPRHPHDPNPHLRHHRDHHDIHPHHEAGNALMTPLYLQVSTGGGDHLLSLDS